MGLSHIQLLGAWEVNQNGEIVSEKGAAPTPIIWAPLNHRCAWLVDLKAWAGMFNNATSCLEEVKFLPWEHHTVLY